MSYYIISWNGAEVCKNPAQNNFRTAGLVTQGIQQKEILEPMKMSVPHFQIPRKEKLSPLWPGMSVR